MIKDIVTIVGHYPELREIGKRRRLSVPRLILKAVRQFDREFLPNTPQIGELLTLEEGQKITPDEARALQRKLGQYFAKLGAKGMSPRARKKRAREAARKRWESGSE